MNTDPDELPGLVRSVGLNENHYNNDGSDWDRRRIWGGYTILLGCLNPGPESWHNNEFVHMIFEPPGEAKDLIIRTGGIYGAQI